MPRQILQRRDKHLQSLPVPGGNSFIHSSELLRHFPIDGIRQGSLPDARTLIQPVGPFGDGHGLITNPFIHGGHAQGSQHHLEVGSHRTEKSQQMQPFPVHRHFQLVQFFVISDSPVGGRLILLQKAGGGQIKGALRLIGHLEQMRIQGGKGGVKLPQGVRVVIHDSEYWLDDWIRFCRHDKKDAACADCSFWRRWQPASAQCRKHGAHARLLLWKCSLKKA